VADGPWVALICQTSLDPGGGCSWAVQILSDIWQAWIARTEISWAWSLVARLRATRAMSGLATLPSLAMKEFGCAADPGICAAT